MSAAANREQTRKGGSKIDSGDGQAYRRGFDGPNGSIGSWTSLCVERIRVRVGKTEEWIDVAEIWDTLSDSRLLVMVQRIQAR